MWRYLLAIILMMFLAGCSVTIDPNEVNHQNERTSENNDQQPTPTNESELSNGEKSDGIIEMLEGVFNLDWSSRKDSKSQHIFYLALGDSLTRGVGDELREYGYTIRLQEQVKKWPMIKSVELDNRGKNGRRSDQLLSLLQKGHYDEEIAQANLVTITLGGNDVMKVVKRNLFSLKKEMFDKELPGFEQRYEEILSEIRLRNPEVPIIMIGFYNPFSIVVDEITAFDPIISEWNTVIDQVASRDNNACFVPIDDLFSSNEDMVYHVDFFHPNATGYKRITNRIIERMQTCDIEQMSDGLIGFEEWEDE